MTTPLLIFNGPADAALTVVLAHGAGAPMDSPFMNFFAGAIAARGYGVARFEFPYMEARRAGGGHRPPDRLNVLLDTWQSVIDRLGPERLVIGGKSLGGRMASMVADHAGVRGLLCLGYPFHPPGRLDRPRIDHLLRLQTPTLILQGTRDPFGSPAEIAGYPLSQQVRLHWLPDGDHGFAPRSSSGRTEAQNWADATDVIDAYLKGRLTTGSASDPNGAPRLHPNAGHPL